MATTPVPGTGATFGALLRSYRIRAGLTQEALAELSGLSTRGISDLERGLKRAPRRDTVALLLGTLELSVDGQAALVAAARPQMNVTHADALQRFPVPPSSLIGRDRETATIVNVLDDEGVRLLTLVGPAGVGKTRLALAAAQQVANRVTEGPVFVDLAPIRDHALVLPTIAAAIGVRDSGTRPLAETLATTLAHRHLLLVLDNCEQVVDAAPEIAKLLADCSELVILATSRIALRLGAEQVLPVLPLDLPDLVTHSPLASQDQSAAVALFTTRAHAADPAFALNPDNADTVTALVHRLDGLPLAIELAAARVRALPPAVLLARLDRRLAVMTGGLRDAPARQRTMRDAIAWSYDLLTVEHQAHLRQLSIFVGGSTLEAAESIRGVTDPEADVLEGLATLVDASLLQVSAGFNDEPRYRMLEVVREFGLEQLTGCGEEAHTRNIHAAYYHALFAPAARGEHWGPHEIAWLERTEAELGNLRAALTWTLDGGSDPALGLRLAAALWQFWMTRGGLIEGIDWLERALACGRDVPADARAQALLAYGLLITTRPDYERAAAALEEALSIFNGIGDLFWTAFAQLALGVTEQGREQLERSDGLYEAALAKFEAAGATIWMPWAHFFLGVNARLAGNFDRAQTSMETALALAYEVDTPAGVAACLGGIGATAFLQGDYDRANTYGRQSLALRYEIRERTGVAEQLVDLAMVAAAGGDRARAARMYASAYTLREAHGIDSLRFDRARDAGFVQSLRESLGEESFSAAWDSGRALSMDVAVAEALTGDGGKGQSTGSNKDELGEAHP